jgi:nucleotide-binding universal stress UspA family protein
MAIEFRHILVPVDFTEASTSVLDAASDLAKKFGSQLTLVHVYEVPAYVYGGVMYAPTELFAPIAQAARAHMEQVLAGVRAAIPEAKGVLRQGLPSYEILAAIDELHPDLVIMGTHGRRGVRHVLLGSVAEKVVRMSAAPVLTLRVRDPAPPP